MRLNSAALRHWLDSKWCRKEFRLAQRLNKRIIGVLIAEVAIKQLPEELTASWQLVNLTSGNDHQLLRAIHPDTCEERHIHFSTSGLARLRTGLVKAGLNPLFFEWPPKHDLKRIPYRGMSPLEADDCGIFFGREAPTNELMARLRGLRIDPSPRFMVILGASGAGKSSFLRAGILPRLSRDERHFLPLPIVRPTNSVLWGEHGLLQALNDIFEQHQSGITRGTLRGILQAGIDNTDQLVKLLNQLSSQCTLPQLEGETQSTTPTLVLTVDQGEELFQSEGAEEATIFLQWLRQLASHPDLALIVLFTIRSDTYESLQTSSALTGLTQQTFSLTPMPQGAYKDALPLLAFTLERLYLEYGGDGHLTLADYHTMGGLKGAIEAAVEQALLSAKRDPALANEHGALTKLLRQGFIPWLADIDSDTKLPRRRVANLNDIPEQARQVLNHLIEQRLLATDVNASNNKVTIEPAHEALLRQWGLLRRWLNEDFSALILLENVQRASREWTENNHSNDWLNHTAGRLEDAEQLKQRSDLSRFLQPSDWNYLTACRAMADQQREVSRENFHQLPC
jgi:hypothetical protein